MNLLIKRNVEEFLRLLGNDFYLFDNRVKLILMVFLFLLK